MSDNFTWRWSDYDRGRYIAGNEPFVHYFTDRPREVGHYSCTPELSVDDNQCLRKLKVPPSLSEDDLMNSDEYLNLSDPVVLTPTPVTDQSTQPRNPLLRYLTEKNHDKDFVATSTKPLSSLLNTPYFGVNNRGRKQNGEPGWSMGVTQWQGVHYIKLHPGPQHQSSSEKWTMGQPQAQLGNPQHRFNFRSEMTQPGVTGEFHRVMEAVVGGHRLLYSGQMCCKSREDSYITLNTKPWFLDRYKKGEIFVDKANFRTWCAVNSLMGISHAVCGYLRQEDSNIIGLRGFKTGNMESRHNSNVVSLPAGGIMENWRSSTCVKFLTDVLDHIKKLHLDDDPRKVCSLNWKYGDNKVEVIRDDTNYGWVLPERHYQHNTTN